MANKAVQVASDSGAYAVTLREAAEVAETLRENIGDTLTTFDLMRIKMPSGGGTAWAVPTLEDEEMRKTVQGVIVGWRTMRSYWEGDIESTGGGAPPDCSSQDGVVGVGNPGGECATCPLNQWGTAGDGARGKACKEMRALFVMTEDSRLPYLFMMPPTSIKPVKQYMFKLAANGMPYWGVVSDFGLSKTRNAQGIEYAVLDLTYARTLDNTERELARSYKDALTPMIEQVAIEVTSADYADGIDDAPFD